MATTVVVTTATVDDYHGYDCRGMDDLCSDGCRSDGCRVAMTYRSNDRCGNSIRGLFRLKLVRYVVVMS